MPVLKNAKHERLAQAIAAGETLAKAAEKAGYKPSSSSACRMAKKINISQRVTEILDAGATKIIEKTYTRDTLLGYLEEARRMGIELEKPTAVVQASIGMARVLGLIIDRREVGEAGAFDALTDDELVAEAAKRARALGMAGPKLIEARPIEEAPVDNEPEE